MENQNEVLDMAQRRQRAMRFKRLQKRVQRARSLQMRRFADRSRLTKRATRTARGFFKKRLAGGKSYAQLGTSAKMHIDRRLGKFKGAVKKLATRLMPTVRKKELARRK